MNFTEEQLAFRDSIRRMAERHVAPIAAEIDETDRFPTELLPIYGDMGLMQLWVPEKYGGPEGNLTLMCIAREEISRHLAGLRLDRRPEHDVHHAAAALRHRGAARSASCRRSPTAAWSRRSPSPSRRPAPTSARCRPGR